DRRNVQIVWALFAVVLAATVNGLGPSQSHAAVMNVSMQAKGWINEETDGIGGVAEERGGQLGWLRQTTDRVQADQAQEGLLDTEFEISERFPGLKLRMAEPGEWPAQGNPFGRLSGIGGLSVWIPSLPTLPSFAWWSFPLKGETVSVGRSKTEQVPLPAAIILFWSGLSGMVGIVVRRQTLTCPQERGAGSLSTQADRVRLGVIFLISADQTLKTDLGDRLQGMGYQCRTALSVATVLAAIRREPPLLLLVDRRTEGWEILRTEQSLSRVPLVTLIPHDMDESDDAILSDLERGADGVYACRDGHRLFLAVVEAYCRRAGYALARRGFYQVGHLCLDADRRELTVAGKPVHLSATQFRILQAFMSSPFKVFSRRELIDYVWGAGFAISQHALDVHIHALRRLLDRDADRSCAIVAIKGVGFKFKLLKQIGTADHWKEEWPWKVGAEQALVTVGQPSMLN
ncbi:MAG: winged-helix domain-containing protein, partial [Nitrospira sp.]